MTLMILLLGSSLSPPEGEGQVADTITIVIEGSLTSITLTAQYVTPFQVGDTVIFHAEVYDEDGDPINAVITFLTEDSTALRLEALDTSGLPGNANEVRGIALKKATVRVWAVAEPVTEMALASFRPPDSLNWTGFDTIPPVSSLQYCAYLIRDSTLVVQSAPPPTCPQVFPEPTANDGLYASVLAAVPRMAPPTFIRQFWQRALRGREAKD